MVNTPPVSADRRRWVVLAVGQAAVTAGSAFQLGLPYLIPALRQGGLSLAQAGLLVSCPMAGLMFTLILWGVVADRWGERLTIGLGLGSAGLALLAASVVTDPVPLGGLLAVAGAAGAAVHAASGRLILGWFGAHERGLAMGIRQTAQPLGVALAAASLPTLGRSGPGPALLFLAVLSVATATLVVLLVRDPRRRAVDGPALRVACDPVRSGTPYRTPVLWRIHLTSGLMAVPQFAVTTFSLLYLVDVAGWGASRAGRILAAGALGGALMRLAVGVWSDRSGSRLGPFRKLIVAVAVVMVALAAGALTRSPVAVLALLIAVVLTVSPNGLAFTAVAEYAGDTWAGRALGIQNTVQNVFAVATPPLLGAVVTGAGYGPAFAAVAAFPLIATATVPIHGERLHGLNAPNPRRS